MLKKLSEFAVGERGIVLSLEAVGKIKRRLLDLGITPGAEIVLKKLAPLGDPLECGVRGYSLSLRRSEAEVVLMEVSK